MTNQNGSSQNEIAFRPPIVTIMGHVDHGKTSLLDYIRKSSVAEKEAGGITQSIGAYQAEYKGKKITFIDTPGHAAFSQMRSRGGKAADIVILVVSAADGVMPQTKEAISIAKFVGTPMIVAINKVDLPEANVQKVKQQLAENSVQVEDWGGDVLSVEVSAKTGQGVDKLLEAISTLAEMANLASNKSADFEGFIIESKLDAKRGPIFTGIIKNGVLRVGQEIYASNVSGKVKALINFKGEQIKEAVPGDPVEVLGFSTVPKVGDVFVDAKNKELIKLLDDNQPTIIGAEGAEKTVSIILKADNQGSLEALEGAIRNIEFKDLKIKILHKATGDISESDILLAKTTDAIVFGFNSRFPSKVEDLARSSQVVVKTYKIIYELLEDVDKVLREFAFKEESKIKGRAQVLKLFPLKSGDVVAGSKVLAGALKEGSKVSIFREGSEEAIYTGKIKTLKRGVDDVPLVGKDNECGVLLKPQFEDIKPLDTIEVL